MIAIPAPGDKCHITFPVSPVVLAGPDADQLVTDFARQACEQLCEGSGCVPVDITQVWRGTAQDALEAGKMALFGAVGNIGADWVMFVFEATAVAVPELQEPPSFRHTSSPSQCATPGCDRRPRYLVEGSSNVGGSCQFWVCRGHLDDALDDHHHSWTVERHFRVSRTQ